MLVVVLDNEMMGIIVHTLISDENLILNLLYPFKIHGLNYHLIVHILTTVNQINY